jgi:hypothetical protein
MTSSDEVQPGRYFLRKNGDSVRKVESVLPGGYYARVRHYYVGHPPAQMWDKIGANYLAGTWGRAITEAEARRLIPDMAERDARLDAERVPFREELEPVLWHRAIDLAVRQHTEQLSSAVSRLRHALDALCRATRNARAAGVVKARRAALDVLAATAPTDGSQDAGQA